VRALVAILAAAVLLGLTFLGFPGRFFHRDERPALHEDYFEKLRIEAPGKEITAPDFSLEDLSGKRINLKSFRGKVAFLNFWATWCIPCREEMPAMEKLHREFKKAGLEVVAVNFRETKKEVRKFFDELGLTFTGLLDKEGKVSEEYGAWSLPLSYFVNRKGEFAGKVIGPRKWESDESKAFFKVLLAERPEK
jgi:peroxiredoxin